MVELLAKNSLCTDYTCEKREEVLEELKQAQKKYGIVPTDGVKNGLWTPKTIYDLIDRRVYGQEKAKREAALIFYNIMEGRRCNTVFCGPTGCGKSEIWRQLEHLFPDRVRMIDASRMAADGWRGSVHLRDIFEGVPNEILKDGMVVVLDEADKLCCEVVTIGDGVNANAHIQNSLLKMMDGDVIEFGNDNANKQFSVDCSKVSVVLLGAFETLLQDKSKKSSSRIGFGAMLSTEYDYTDVEIGYSDLIDAGMRREIAGRINNIIALKALDESDYLTILKNYILPGMQSAFKGRIEIDDKSAESLAYQAASEGLGVRWMRSQIMNAVNSILFYEPETEIYNVEISA